MTNTVARLMRLVDDYAALRGNWDSGNTSETTPHLVVSARQALEAELTRLFTPLSDEQIATVYFGATGQSLRPQDNVLAHKFTKAIEQQHGIGGES